MHWPPTSVGNPGGVVHFGVHWPDSRVLLVVGAKVSRSDAAYLHGGKFFLIFLGGGDKQELYEPRLETVLAFLEKLEASLIRLVE